MVRLRASGQHHSAKSLPHVPGTDGVGYIPAEGDKKVFFFAFAGSDASIGSFRTIIDVPRLATLDLPSTISPVHAASMASPALSSWMAIKHTVGPGMLPTSFRVVILGVTSLSGSAAVKIARRLGAGWVAGVGRDEERLRNLAVEEKGELDESIILRPEGTDWTNVNDVDLVLDYYSGSPALELLKALRPFREQRTWWVQMGDLAGSDMVLPATLLKSKNVLLCGSGIGAYSGQALIKEMPDILNALSGIPEHSCKIEKLQDVKQHWDSETSKEGRIVLVP